MSFFIEQDILQFDVAVENLEVVQMLEGDSDFCHVEKRLFLVEMLTHVKVSKEFATANKVQN